MTNFTTLRLRNKHHENGGEWFAESVTDYHKRILAEVMAEEPAADWHLETRGLSAPWHRCEVAL